MSTDSLGKGTIDLAILHLLSKEDMYGYQICQSVSEKTNGLITLNMGAMYTTLYRLKECGYISDYERLAGKKLKRVYYHLEESGATYLKECRMAYEQLQAAMNHLLD